MVSEKDLNTFSSSIWFGWFPVSVLHGLHYIGFPKMIFYESIDICISKYRFLGSLNPFFKFFFVDSDFEDLYAFDLYIENDLHSKTLVMLSSMELSMLNISFFMVSERISQLVNYSMDWMVSSF